MSRALFSIGRRKSYFGAAVSRCLMTSMKREPVGPGEESVWDYPRPPRIESTRDRVTVVFNGETVADSTRAHRVLETSHPPTYYIPLDDCKMEYFRPSQDGHSTFCEFKGNATYYDVKVGERVERNAAWAYPHVHDNHYLSLENSLAVYPARMDACYVNDEKATPQAGRFYGGWITKKIKGPFKGGPNTLGW